MYSFHQAEYNFLSHSWMGTVNTIAGNNILFRMENSSGLPHALVAQIFRSDHQLLLGLELISTPLSLQISSSSSRLILSLVYTNLFHFRIYTKLIMSSSTHLMLSSFLATQRDGKLEAFPVVPESGSVRVWKLSQVNSPQQVHVAYGRDPLTSVRFSW